MAALLATARSFGSFTIDIAAADVPIPARRRPLSCRWSIDPATGKLVCAWDDDPPSRSPTLHLRLVKA
jgi:hypothetical protein